MVKNRFTKVVLLTGVLFAGSLGLIGCGGLSDEQIAQINALKAEVSSLETEVANLKSQKATLERQVGEINAKLEQCAKDKEITKRNLEKLPK